MKVQRPGVGATVARDLDLLHMMAAALERAVPETKIYSPVGLVNQFDRSITSELNYLVEADHCERFAQNFEGHPEVRFPKIYRQASSRAVLVQEFFDGKKITETDFDGKKIAKASVAVIIKMIFEDGFFHADPHPGNVIILGTKDEPVIGLIDTGMVGRLSPELRERTIDLMIAAARKDTYGVADALYAIARPTKKVDMREYRAEVATLADKYLGRPLGQMDLAGMIRDLVQGAMKYGLEIPTDFLLVGKALMTVEGVGKQLDPDARRLRRGAALLRRAREEALLARAHRHGALARHGAGLARERGPSARAPRGARRSPRRPPHAPHDERDRDEEPRSRRPPNLLGPRRRVALRLRRVLAQRRPRAPRVGLRRPRRRGVRDALGEGRPLEAGRLKIAT